MKKLFDYKKYFSIAPLFAHWVQYVMPEVQIKSGRVKLPHVVTLIFALWKVRTQHISLRGSPPRVVYYIDARVVLYCVVKAQKGYAHYTRRAQNKGWQQQVSTLIAIKTRAGAIKRPRLESVCRTLTNIITKRLCGANILLLLFGSVCAARATQIPTRAGET